MFQDCVVGTREIQELEQICLTRQQRIVTGVGTTATTPSFSLSLFSCDIESMSDLIHLIEEKFPTLVERLEFGGSFNVSYAQLSLLISATSLSCRTLNLMLNLQQQQQQRAQQQEHLLDEPRVVVPSTVATLSTTTVASPQLQQQVQVPCNPFQSFWNHATLHTLRVSELDGSSTTATTPSLLTYLAETLPQLPQLRIVTLFIWNLTTTSFCTLVQKGLLPAQQLQVVELSEVRFGSINQSALPIFLQLLFDTNLIHLGICGLYSLFQNNNDDNDNNSRSNNNNENSNDDNDNNQDNRWIPNSFRRNPPYYHNSNSSSNNNNNCSLSKQIQQILNNRKLKGQCIKNSTLQIFTMRNISIMSQDVTKELLILFLTRFSVLTSLSWTDHAVSLLSSSVPSLQQSPVPSQLSLSSSSSLSLSSSSSFAVPLHTNLSLTYFGCQKWNSSHYSHQSRIVLPKPIQLWLYLWTKRNRNWSRVNKFLKKKKNTQVSSCRCCSCCCHVDDDDDKNDNDIHNTTTTTQQQLNRKNQISSSSSCWALYPLIMAQSHPNSIQHALLPSLIHSRFMESNNVVVVV